MSKAKIVPVTVIVPTYNRERLLVRAIYSVVSQTAVPERILVVDDGSTDNSEHVVLSFNNAYLKSKSLPEIDYIRLTRNRGANFARNVGLDNAKSKYVAFLDSDDFWHDTKLEKQLKAVELSCADSEGKVIVYTGRLRTDGKLNLIKRQSVKPGVNKQSLSRSNSIGTLSSVLINRKILHDAGGFDNSLDACQDWDMYIRVIDKVTPIAVADPLIVYFDEGSGRLTGHSKKRLRSHLKMYKKHLKGVSSKRELSSFYRNIAEDLSQLKRRKLAINFLAEHYRFKYDRKWLAIMLAHLNWKNIKQIRYKNYVKSQQRRTAENASHFAQETQEYLSWYRGFHERSLQMYESLPKPAQII